ncbi:MAG: NTP transferase domain-containing protein [Hydrogenimonas sp.]|nr:NTP transferase domain-containing protein [Hydrogenimonas sp.]
MGKDKALLPFCGFSTLAEFQYRRLKPHFSATYLSAKREKFPFQAPVILDDLREDIFTPVAGLLKIFDELKDDKLFILSVDTPFVGVEEIRRIVQRALDEKFDAVVAKSPGGIHPMCGVYSRSITPFLKEALERESYRLTDILDAANCGFVEFAFDDPFFNINRPAEYESALKKLS